MRAQPGGAASERDVRRRCDHPVANEPNTCAGWTRGPKPACAIFRPAPLGMSQYAILTSFKVAFVRKPGDNNVGPILRFDDSRHLHVRMHKHLLEMGTTASVCHKPLQSAAIPSCRRQRKQWGVDGAINDDERQYGRTHGRTTRATENITVSPGANGWKELSGEHSNRAQVSPPQASCCNPKSTSADACPVRKCGRQNPSHHPHVPIHVACLTQIRSCTSRSLQSRDSPRRGNSPENRRSHGRLRAPAATQNCAPAHSPMPSPERLLHARQSRCRAIPRH